MKNILFSCLVLPFIFSAVTASAQNWYPVGISGFNDTALEYLAMAIDNTSGHPYVAYTEWGNSQKITVKKYDGTNWVTVGTPGFSQGGAGTPSIAVSNSGTPYVIYEDIFNGSKATVMKFDGTNWVVVGSPGFSAGGLLAETVQGTTIAVDKNETPYVAFMNDFGAVDAGPTIVMKYDGSHWMSLGGSVSDTTYAAAITLDSGGIPYVVYQDFSNSRKTTVMKYNGSDMATVGSPGFSSPGAQYQSVAVDLSGTVYVANQDNGDATVFKYDGVSWSTVGAPGFSGGGVFYTSVAVTGGGVPYVAYTDLGDSSKATVMKYNGASWVNVGTRGFSAGEVGQTSIAMDKNGRTYVAYIDYANGSKATVMKFDYPAEIENVISNNGPVVWPNPARSVLTVSSPELINDITIVDLLGKVVYTNKYNAKRMNVDVSTLPTGMYFVKVNETNVQKFIKQ